jgi:hypothetical protein
MPLLDQLLNPPPAVAVAILLVLCVPTYYGIRRWYFESRYREQFRPAPKIDRRESYLEQARRRAGDWPR